MCWACASLVLAVRAAALATRCAHRARNRAAQPHRRLNRGSGSIVGAAAGGDLFVADAAGLRAGPWGRRGRAATQQGSGCLSTVSCCEHVRRPKHGKPGQPAKNTMTIATTWRSGVPRPGCKLPCRLEQHQYHSVSRCIAAIITHTGPPASGVSRTVPEPPRPSTGPALCPCSAHGV